MIKKTLIGVLSVLISVCIFASVKALDNAAYDDRDTFTIPDSTFIKIKSPKGGEKWRLKEIRYISWQSEGITEDLKITLWKDERLLGVIASDVSPDSDIHKWMVGEYRNILALPGGGYKIKIKEKGKSVSDMSNDSFEILKEEEETDLSISDCVIKDRSGKQARKLRKGDIGKVEFLVRIPADLPCFKFNVEAWSIHGQPSSSKFVLRGKTTHKHPFSFRPPWTEKTGYFYLTFKEEKTGPFTLFLKVNAVSPKIDINTRNNKCQIPFEMVVDMESKEDTKIKDVTYTKFETRPNLKVKFREFNRSGTNFTVWMINENYRVGKITADGFLLYLRYDVWRNIDGKSVNFHVINNYQRTVDHLNSYEKLSSTISFDKWKKAGAHSVTVIIDSRNDVKESNENDNQCVINF